MDDEGVVFSRSGNANLFGKLTEDIGKLKLSAATAEGLQRKANEAGLPVMEYVRLIVDINVHGVNKVLSVNAQRVNLVAGIGSEKG